MAGDTYTVYIAPYRGAFEFWRLVLVSDSYSNQTVEVTLSVVVHKCVHALQNVITIINL